MKPKKKSNTRDTKTRIKPIKILVSNSEVGRDAPKQEVSLRLRTRVKKDKSAAEAARNADARHETKLTKGIATPITTRSEDIRPRDPRAVDTRRRRSRQKR